MAKLSAELRARATKELQSGVSTSQVCEKFGITPSAASYLKNKATGSLPEVVEFEANFSKYQLDRLKRMVQAGTKITEVAQDYEVSRRVIESYCAKNNIRPATGPVINMKMLRVKKTSKKKK